MPESSPAVVAGSKAFVDALQPVLRLRLGVSPVAVQDPAALAVAAATAGRLVVVEDAGPEWLAAVQAVRAVRARGTLSIVAAVPVARSGDTAALRGAGVDDAVRWDGRVDAILWALDRLPPTVAAPTVQAARAPGPPPLPRAAPPPTPAAGPPPPSLPRVVPPPIARPPGAAAISPVEAPAAPRPRVEAAAAAALADPAPPVLKPVPAATPEARAAAAPTAAADPAPLAEDAADPFAPEDAVDLRELMVPGDPEASPAAGQVLPARQEAERMLAAHVRGEAAPSAVEPALTARVAGGLTELERAALGGQPLPFDGAPLRAAAALRWLVAVALEPGAAGHLAPGQVEQLPAEVDAALGALKVLAEGSSPDVQRAIADSRNALVTDAVRLTEALTAAIEVPAAPAPVIRPAAPAARVLSNEVAARELGGRIKARWWVPLVVLAVLAGGYHLQAWRARAARPWVSPSAAVPSAPAGTIATVRGTTKVLVQQAGRTVDRAELERFKQREAQLGNVVKQIAPGTWIVEPAPASGGTP